MDGAPGTVTRCRNRVHKYADDVTEADVGDDGEWIADDLMEGVYEVIVDLPAGYVHVDSEGREGATMVWLIRHKGAYFSQQAAELTGGRADAGTKPFHIKDRNAGDWRCNREAV